MAKANTSRKVSVSAPRQSLAATHPSNYSQATTKAMPPPPSTPQSKIQKPEKRSNKPKTMKPADRYPTPSPSPPKRTASPDDHVKPPFAAVMPPGNEVQPSKQAAQLPWQKHTDPTLTTSDKPPYWSRNHTVLKSDTDITIGSVVSPTWMHGLPFGTMTEAGHHYPSKERLD